MKFFRHNPTHHVTCTNGIPFLTMPRAAGLGWGPHTLKAILKNKAEARWGERYSLLGLPHA